MKTSFRRALLANILSVTVGPTALAACALAGCGGDATDDGSATQQVEQPVEDCFTWPAEPNDACGTASATGTGGAGGAAGVGGAGPCPSPDDAGKYFASCGFNTIQAGAEKAGQCCYMVTFGAGRPLVIEERARTAAPIARVDWSAALRAPACGELSPDARADLARGWAADALLEHASVASFSLRPSCDLRELVASTMRDGCVGETVAACELEERAAVARGTLGPLLRGIARDEARHAELAWRIVAWAIDVGGPKIADAAREALSQAIRAVRAAPVDAAVTPLLAHGRLSARALAAAREAALVEVILPAARAVLRDPLGPT